MALFDTTGLIYQFFESLTNNVTGSQFLTMLLIIILIVIACAALRIPIEFSVLFVFPLAFYFVALDTAFMAVAGVVLIYVAFLIAKNFFFWR